MLAADSFSVVAVEGACPEGHGIGRVYDVTETCLVPDASCAAFASAPLRRRALAVRFAGLDMTEMSRLPLQGFSGLLNNTVEAREHSQLLRTHPAIPALEVQTVGG